MPVRLKIDATRRYCSWATWCYLAAGAGGDHARDPPARGHRRAPARGHARRRGRPYRSKSTSPGQGPRPAAGGQAWPACRGGRRPWTTWCDRAAGRGGRRRRDPPARGHRRAPARGHAGRCGRPCRSKSTSSGPGPRPAAGGQAWPACRGGRRPWATWCDRAAGAGGDDHARDPPALGHPRALARGHAWRGVACLQSDVHQLGRLRAPGAGAELMGGGQALPACRGGCKSRATWCNRATGHGCPRRR